MKEKIASRTPLTDVTLCKEKVGGNTFDLVLIAARRTRELLKRCDDPYAHVTHIDALLEIQDDKIDTNAYLKNHKK
jgi:DNA-directed RNA polymerase subunit K/omega